NRLHPDEKGWILAACEAHVNDHTGNTPYNYEYRIRAQNGEYKFFHVFGSTYRDANGVPLRFAGALKDITEQKEMQKNAREAEERAQILLDATPLCINLWDENIKNIITNAAAVELFGMSDKREFIDNFYDFSPKIQPDGQDSVTKSVHMVKEAFKTGYYQTEWMHQKLDGELIPSEVTLIRVKYKDGYAVAGYIRDLRNEKKMLATIHEEQAKLKEMEIKSLEAEEARKAFGTLTHILSGLDALIYVTNPRTGEILFINENMIEYYGLEKDCTGKICYKVFHKDKDEQCDFCPCRKLDQNPDKELVWEEYLAKRDMTYRHTERYIKWTDGSIVHLRHSVDITDIKKANTALDKRLEQQDLMTYISQNFLLHIKSKEIFDEMVVRSLNRVGAFMEAELILLYVYDEENKEFSCIHEWKSENNEMPPLKGAKFPFVETDISNKLFNRIKDQEIYHMTSDDPDVRKLMEPYRSEYENYLCTALFIDDKLYGMMDFSWANDGRKWNQYDINLAEFFSNVLTGVFRRQKIAEQLISAKVMAEQGNRSKSIFLASMSHEVRTPLNAILGIAEIQLQDDALTPALEEAFGKIHESGDLLLNIINDILDHSKIEAGKLEIFPVKYDMPSILNDTIQLLRLRFDSKPLEFKLSIDENTPLDLFGDELRIKQVLSNVLSNAFKYTDEGEVVLSVSAEPMESTKEREMVMLKFTITDTGQGMNDDQIGRLFDEYTRFNLQTNRSTVGTGLGMNITKRFVELMNGKIVVKSAPGKGTTFTVYLPQERIGNSVCGNELGENLQLSHRHSSKKIKSQMVREYMPYGSVLIVDDVESNLYVAKGLLSSYGLKIETAGSGFRAIELIKRKNQYDIIFMDHMMPGIDGMETTKMIRELGYKGSIVALTANAVVGQSEIFLANGFDGFLSKPIDIRELNVVLNDLIRSKQTPDVIKAARQKKKGQAKSERQSEKLTGEMLKAFMRDAEKTIIILKDLYKNIENLSAEEMKSYVISIHGIKNALYNIDENKLSSIALSLEQAGRERNVSLLLETTPLFIKQLKALVAKIKSAEKNNGIDISDEDRFYLYEKITIIKEACQVFDKKTAKAALDELYQKPWSQTTISKLDMIAVNLLHSAFNKAVSVADEMLK
ncbi:MAG: ATP-binding protein, partial [Lachnospiraceae bacterium]|nr:ATP-binding protein [Lachnospiraceae bacterium]